MCVNGTSALHSLSPAFASLLYCWTVTFCRNKFLSGSLSIAYNCNCRCMSLYFWEGPLRFISTACVNM